MSINQEDINYYKKLKTQVQLDEELFYECREGNLEAIQYLLTSHDLKIHPNIKSETDNGYNVLDLVLMNGHFHILKYLLLDEELKISEYNPPIRYDNIYEGVLEDIAEIGNVELLNFVIKEFPLFTQKAVEIRCDRMLNHCFEREHLEMMIYLMDYDKSGWDNACWKLLCKAEQENNHKIIEHLVINLAVENSLLIMNQALNTSEYPEIKKVLEKKLLAYNMNNELAINTNKKNTKL